MKAVVCSDTEVTSICEWAMLIPIDQRVVVNDYDTEESLASKKEVQIIESYEVPNNNSGIYIPILSKLVTKLAFKLGMFKKIIKIDLIKRPEGISLDTKEMKAIRNYLFRELRSEYPSLKLKDFEVGYYRIVIHVKDYGMVSSIFNLIKASSLDQLTEIGDQVVGFNT